MVCYHGIPLEICPMCRPIAVKIDSQIRQERVEESRRAQEEERLRRIEQEAAVRENQRRQEERREREREEKERQRITLINKIESQCIAAAEHGDFLAAWSISLQLRDLNTKLSSRGYYKLAEAILLDESFLSEEINLLKNLEKIQLLICIVRDSYKEDKENFLLRRALSFARHTTGDALPALSYLVNNKEVKCLDAIDDHEKFISYEELALNPSLTQNASCEKIHKPTIKRDFVELSKRLYSIIDQLIVAIEHAPNTSSINEAVTSYQEMQQKLALEKKQQEEARRAAQILCEQQEAERVEKKRLEKEQHAREQAEKKRLEEEDRIKKETLQKEQEERKVENILLNAIQGIEAYQKLPRTFWGGHLSFFAALFDNKRGKNRAQAYHNLLSNEEYNTSQKCLSLLALLRNRNGVELRNQVIRKLENEDETILTLRKYLSKYCNIWNSDPLIKNIIDLNNSKQPPRIVF